MKLSVIIPGWHDPLMQKTIDDMLKNEDIELEVLAVVDGMWLTEPLREDSRVKIIQLPENLGMRGAINAGIERASGEYLCKTDAHCCFAPGFARNMIENCEDNWLVIPRRYSLDDHAWCPESKHPPRDYHYLRYPQVDMAMTPHSWGRREGGEIDDTMSFQGSCWFANRKQFMKRVGFLDGSRRRYGDFAAEQLEVGLKYWLGGGEVKVNKKTWYAHLHKNPRHYNSGQYRKKGRYMYGWRWATNHWLNNNEPGMIHPFNWLVEKFSPVPTWPENASI